MIYILLIGLILELIYSYRVFGKDLFSPSAVLCEVFILSTIACIFNIDKWGVDLSGTTVAVILGGNAVFIGVSSIIHHIYKKKYGDNKRIKNGKLEYINIRYPILLLVVLAYLIFAVFYVRANLTVASELTYSGDIGQAMSLYRHEVVHEDGVSISIWLSRAAHVFDVGVYVLIFVFINNLIVNRKNRSNFLLLLPIFSFLFSSIFTAQRTTILLAFIYALFVTYSLLNRQYQFINKINTRYIFRGAIIVAIFLLLFGVTRSFFGRDDRETVFDNVTYYVGNSIESLDLFIKRPIESKQFGEETFRQFRVNLSKYDLVD